MSVPHDVAIAAPGVTLPGAAVIARIRRLISVTVVAGVLYCVFLGASKGGCAGGITGDGGFLDANGDLTDLAPSCVSMSLRPSPLMLLVLAGMVLFALRRVLRRAGDEASAIRILDRTALAVLLVAAVSVVIAQVWFGLIPMYGIGDSGTYIWPFPFATVDFVTSPMTPS
jgi:hypothetical protein